MKYVIGTVLIVIATWLGFKNPVYNMALTSGEVMSPPRPDHTLADGWYIQPAETPPGAWETPWGVDIFVIYPAPRINTPHGFIDAETAVAHPSYIELDAEIHNALPADAFIYVPKYRPTSNTSASETTPDTGDLLSALDAYLGNTNRGRAIMLVGVGATGAQLTPLLARLNQDDLRIRFAGLVHFTQHTDNDIESPFPDLECSPALEGACYQSVQIEQTRPIGDHLLPRLPKLRAKYAVLDPAGTANAILAQQNAVSIWLDANAPKPAEPLFGFEAIETAPIYRPNGDALKPEE